MATKNVKFGNLSFVIGEDGKLRPSKENVKTIENPTETTKRVAREMYAEKSAEKTI